MGELSLSENQKFMTRQIVNTVNVIEMFRNDNELSYIVLQNALLSMVVLPFEKEKAKDGKRIWNGSYDDLKDDIGFTEIVFKPIKPDKNNAISVGNKTLYAFIAKFRNSVAHQNIQITSNKEDGGNCTEFFNIYPLKKGEQHIDFDYKEKGLKKKGGGIEDFRVSFTQEQLYKFAFYVADTFIKSITGKSLEENRNIKV